MFNDTDFLNRIKLTLIQLLNDTDISLSELLKQSEVTIEETDYDNWNGGTCYYTVFIDTDISIFSKHQNVMTDYEQQILHKLEIMKLGNENHVIGNVAIRPILKYYIDWSNVSLKIGKEDFLKKIFEIKDLMIAVATNGPMVKDVNFHYIGLYNTVDDVLVELGIKNPNSFKKLWDWRDRWSQNDLPTYSSRRMFIDSMYGELIRELSASDDKKTEFDVRITGWNRLDRVIQDIKRKIIYAKDEEDFQSIGLLSREAFITLAQNVYDREKHGLIDDKEPSKTDSKRMLESYIANEIGGKRNEELRKYVRSAIALANGLVHDRNANRRDTTMCVIALTSLVNIIKVITDKKDVRF